MNRKQRGFGEIARLMRSHRRPDAGFRGVRFYRGTGSGRHFDDGAGGGGAASATLELPKIEIPASFKLDNPEKDVPEALEKIRASMVDLERRGPLTGEAFQRVVADLEEVRKAALEAREGTRQLLREVPAAGDPDEPVKLSRHVGLSLRVSDETDADFQGAFAPLARNGVAGLAQYNVLSKNARELGISDEGTARQLKRLQMLHDATVFMNVAHRGDIAYIQAGAHTSLPWWKELVSLGRKFIGALSDATTAEGKEWVATGMLSVQIAELIELELQFSQVFQRFPMRLASGPWPIKGAHGIGYYIQENVADDGSTANAKVKVKSWATNNVTFTARKMAAGIALSSEWEEDAIINVPAYAGPELALVLGRTREQAVINGQKSATIDGGALAADDGRLMYDGVRRMGRISGKAPRDLGAGITSDDLAAMWGGQGAAGSRIRGCCWLTSTAGFARVFTAKASDNSPLFLTFAQMGVAAPNVTGALGNVMGRPIYLSEFVSEKMEADGTLSDVDAPTGNKTALYHIYHATMKVGERRGTLISRSDDVRFLEDQSVFKATAREDFQALQPPTATNVLVTEGNNIATY